MNKLQRTTYIVPHLYIYIYILAILSSTLLTRCKVYSKNGAKATLDPAM